MPVPIPLGGQSAGGQPFVPDTKGAIILDATGQPFKDSIDEPCLDDGSGCCCIKQARRCSDGSLSGLWAPVCNIPAYPWYVLRAADGQCYYFAQGDPGKPKKCGNYTDIGSLSGVSGCDDPQCGGIIRTGCRVVPANTNTVSVTIAGVSLVSNCLKCTVGAGADGITQGFNLSGFNINGTYTLLSAGGSICTGDSHGTTQIWTTDFTWDNVPATPAFCFFDPNCGCTGAAPIDVIMTLMDGCPQQFAISFTQFGAWYGTLFFGQAGTSNVIANTEGTGCNKSPCAAAFALLNGGAIGVNFALGSGGTATFTAIN